MIKYSILGKRPDGKCCLNGDLIKPLLEGLNFEKERIRQKALEVKEKKITPYNECIGAILSSKPARNEEEARQHFKEAALLCSRKSHRWEDLLSELIEERDNIDWLISEVLKAIPCNREDLTIKEQ